jgi:hypothetical protein
LNSFVLFNVKHLFLPSKIVDELLKEKNTES